MRRLLAAVACALAVLCVQGATASALPPIKHVFLIVLENQNEATSFGTNSPAPYLAHTLTSQGEFLPNYYGTGHESLDNYVTLISGQAPNPDTQGDCQFYQDVLPGTIGAGGQAIGAGCVYPSAVSTVANQLERKGLAWKGYMEDMGNAPGEAAACSHPALNSPDGTQRARAGDQYAARHNPFVYFHSIIDSPSCQANDVALSRLPGDLSSATNTPSYSFITPNLCDDGHDTPCADGRPGGLVSADAFLRTWVPRITGSAAYHDGGLLVVTFDEAASDSSACCNEQPGPGAADPGGPTPGPGGGKVGAVLLSPYVQPGSVNQSPYNHYSLLRSVEDLFALDHLGYAAASGLAPFGADVFNRTPSSGGGGGGQRGSRAAPRIGLAGLPAGCARAAFTARIDIHARAGASTTVVRLDGRRLASSSRANVRIRIPAGRLRPGSHRLVIRAVTRSGAAATLRRRFRRCGLAPRTVPRFAG